ncbi:MAG TPA: class I SAM-dependent methyltransferase, partial [Actinomycetota bacterium]|nr:class I SAM-dependent methyltransferase [Actinomycetota bacterium]
AAGRLRRAFEASEFTEEAMQRALGVEQATGPTTLDVSVFDRRIAEPSRLHTLIRLFVLGLPVAPGDAAVALEPLEPAEAESLGLVRTEADGIHRELSVSIVQGLWLAHDRFSDDPQGSRRDHVLGPGPASRTLAALTVRRPVGLALDLGTGCGIQALLAARHGERVVATDTNERALYCTELNALVNGVENVEVRHGSLYEPVRNEAFGLIASNPPFVVSPETRFEYRDSGMQGDAISAAVVGGAGERLAPGGFATVLCNWILRDGEPWPDPPTRWVEDSGCDAWIVHSNVMDPVTYAATWLTRSPETDFALQLDRWLDYHRSLGAAAIVVGSVVLRRREGGTPWIRADHVESSSDTAGAHIVRLFDNQDLLQRTTDDDLMATRFALPEDTRADQRLAPGPVGWESEETLLKITGGLGFTGRTDPAVLQLLGSCDGTRTLGDLVRETAGVLEVEVDALAPEVAGVVRQMLSLGFLEPVG